MTRFNITAFCSLVAVLGLTTIAQADDRQALIVPLDGSPGGPLKDAPERMSQELEAIIAEGAFKPFEAKVARKELEAIAGCAEASETCMASIAEAMGVQLVVLGSVEYAPDKQLAVALTLYESGKPLRSGTIRVSSKDIDDAVAEFGTKTRAWLESAPVKKAPPPPTPDPTPTPAPVVTAPAPAQPSSPAFDFGRVKPYSYAIAGGGVALIGLGAVLYTVASGKQSDIDDHPTDTLEDLQALEDLESSAKSFATLGNLSTIVGGVAAAAGVTLIVLQGTKKEAQPTAQIAPVAMNDGFGLAFTVRGDL